MIGQTDPYFPEPEQDKDPLGHVTGVYIKWSKADHPQKNGVDGICMRCIPKHLGHYDLGDGGTDQLDHVVKWLESDYDLGCSYCGWPLTLATYWQEAYEDGRASRDDPDRYAAEDITPDPNTWPR